MAKLLNSRRRLDKVTYAPLVLPPGTMNGGALQLAILAGQLRVQPGEARADGGPRDVQEALAALDKFSSAPGGEQRLQAAGVLANLPSASLRQAIEIVGSGRAAALDRALSDVVELARRYREAMARANEADRDPPEDRPAVVATRRLELDHRIARRLTPDAAEVAVAAVLWAETNAPRELARLLGGPSTIVPADLRRSGADFIGEGLTFLLEQVQAPAVAAAHLTQRNLQPIGLLHLEQLAITPVGIERGELVYSLPLAPGEKVTLAHKEWSLRQEEYARFVQDYFEHYSERGVAEKNDMAVSARTESEHSKTLNMSLPAVPGSATIADGVDAAGSSDVTTEKQAQEQSRRETREITDKASTLAIRDQKVSFTVTTTSGVEDFTARLFENKSANEMMLIDYFRRMRKWHNQLYRTGIRLTYDVVLPDPGQMLRERWLEIKRLDEALATPFDLSIESWVWTWGQPKPNWAITSPIVTSLSNEPADVRYFRTLAGEHGATLPAPPEPVKVVQEGRAVTEAPVRNTSAYPFTIRLTAPEGYEGTSVTISGGVASPADSQIYGEFGGQGVTMKDAAGWKTKTIDLRGAPPPKTMDVAFTTWNGAVGQVHVSLQTVPTQTTWHQWRVAAASAIRQAALARYNERREAMRQRRAALMQELAATDALTLRRMEREQIMYLVLRWLFPDFASSSQAYKDAAAQKPDSWMPAMEYGEYIKFVHRAIDWDHALVLLYPYFWDNPDHHASKLFLDHPDGMHREFLRAGAARVIMPIHPGFEHEVVSLLDKGKLGDTAGSERLRAVIDKVRTAHKRFETLQGEEHADAADGADAPKPGELIGEWFDWTPSSALDMTVKLQQVET